MCVCVWGGGGEGGPRDWRARPLRVSRRRWGRARGAGGSPGGGACLLLLAALLLVQLPRQLLDLREELLLAVEVDRPVATPLHLALRAGRAGRARRAHLRRRRARCRRGVPLVRHLRAAAHERGCAIATLREGQRKLRHLRLHVLLAARGRRRRGTAHRRSVVAVPIVELLLEGVRVFAPLPRGLGVLPSPRRKVDLLRERLALAAGADLAGDEDVVADGVSPLHLGIPSGLHAQHSAALLVLLR